MIIGLDAGTTVIKAVAFDDDGVPVARAAERARLDRAGPGRYEQDADEVFAAASAVLERLPGPFEAIGVTGQGDGVWLSDAAGKPARPAISWLDARAGDILARWQRAGTTEALFRRTGSLLFPGAAAPILAALADEEPHVLAAAETAGYCKDMVVQRLTGLRATDPSDASVPFLDPGTGDYADDLLDLCGLGRYRRLLAPVRTPPMAKRSDGTLVVAAPYDLPACA